LNANNSSNVSIDLRVTTVTSGTVTKLIGIPQPTSGTSREIISGVTLKVNAYSRKRGWGYPEVIDLTLTWASTVSSGVIVAWLTDKLKGRKARLEVNNQQVSPRDEAAIAKAVRAALELQGKQANGQADETEESK
jgi:hypothetical protein